MVQYITGQEPVTVQLGRTNLLIHLKLFLSYRKSNLRDHHQPIWTLIFQLKWIDEFIWPEPPQNFVPPLPVEAPIDVNQPSMSKIEDTEMVVDAEPLSVEARYSDNVDDEGYIKVGSKRKNYRRKRRQATPALTALVNRRKCMFTETKLTLIHQQSILLTTTINE